ncbi:MAG: hypothetical protein AMXMBFR61_27200 [Fimbriimonadales bacterium]
MDVIIRLATMLAFGIIAKHGVNALGRQWARRSPRRIPKLCSYATAGTVAYFVKLGLQQGDLAPMLVYAVFGTVWGIIVGLMLPFAKDPVQRARG